jgi:hypothetical protein
MKNHHSSPFSYGILLNCIALILKIGEVQVKEISVRSIDSLPFNLECSAKRGNSIIGWMKISILVMKVANLGYGPLNFIWRASEPTIVCQCLFLYKPKGPDLGTNVSALKVLTMLRLTEVESAMTTKKVQ